MCTTSERFRFAVEYQYDEPGDFYIAIAMNDIRRGGITFDSGPKRFKMEHHGHHTAVFEIPLTLFNDGEFRLIASLRTPTPGEDKMTDAVAVALDENSCTFAVRDEKNTDSYALLNNRSLEFIEIAQQ